MRRGSCESTQDERTRALADVLRRLRTRGRRARTESMAPEAYVQVVKLALAAGLEVESTVGEVQEDVVAGNAHTGAGDKLSSGCLRVLEMVGTGRPSPLARAFSIYFNILDCVGWLV
ncbi:hypothetical protein PC129_g12314 [Phytophthora cactorum]|uniref:Uncharacterized protein n=1 Tax=Phytophthora cactorum TaxID=29920 RepID=A0A8T1HWD0_9STRA|nr:hypothetical protein PC129_g12314 [Phytophthora cactorum]